MTDLQRKAPNPLEQSGVIGEIQSEVSVEAAPLLKFIIKHSKLIVLLVVLLIGAIVTAGFMQWQAANKQEQAEAELGMILTGATQGADRIAALEAFIAKAPSRLQQGAWLELGMVAQQLGDHQKTAQAFDQAAQLGGTSVLASISRLNQADALMQSGKTDEALKILTALESATNGTMRTLARQTLAAAAEAAGNKELAIKTYEALAAQGPETDLAFYRARLAILKAQQ